jgi:hypothetical protein
MEPPFFVKGKLGLCVSVVTPVAIFMRIGGLNATGRNGCSKVEPVIVRDSSGLSMRAEVGGGGRATVLRPLMIARGLLSAVSFAALAAWDPVLAEGKFLRISGAGKAAAHRLRQFHATRRSPGLCGASPSGPIPKLGFIGQPGACSVGGWGG